MTSQKDKNPKSVDRHVFLPAELDKELVEYKNEKYNGLRAMNKVLVDCIRLGLGLLKSKPKK